MNIKRCCNVRKKYSDDDVKRIVKEALREQQEDDQRIINEAKNDKEQKGDVEIPDYLRKTPPKESVPKHWKVKEKNISEMRTGCGIMLLAPILLVVLMILFLMGMAG